MLKVDCVTFVKSFTVAYPGIMSLWGLEELEGSLFGTTFSLVNIISPFIRRF